MASPTRSLRTKTTASRAARLAQMLAQAADPPSAASLFLDLCLESTGAESGAVFLAEPATGEIAACPASRGRAVSLVSRRQLESVLLSGKPCRLARNARAPRLLALPLREGGRPLGLILLSGRLHKSSKAELLGLAQQFVRRLDAAAGNGHAGPLANGNAPAVDDRTRKLIHDFRNLVAGISGYAQLLHQHAAQLERKQIEDYAAIIERETDRIGRLAEEHLRGLRGEPAQGETRPHIAAEIVGEAHALMAADLERHGIHLLTRIESEAPVHADSDLLLRALVNLLVNARQAIPGGGIVEIAAENAGGCVEFRVSDSGSGIPKDLAKKLFQAPASHGKRNGNGLGLCIVKEAADLFGGSVRIEGSPFGGTTVVLSLPV